MIRCRTAIQEGSDCGNTICCIQCEKHSGCEMACEYTPDECEDAIVEEDALTVFQKKEVNVIKAMADMLQQKKALEEKEKEVRKQLVDAMDAYGVKSFENDLLKVTYIAPTTKTTVDSKALKKDLPDTYAKYSKTSNVSASVRIALKEGK